MKMNKRDSYTSADNLPMKLLTDKEVMKSITEKKVIPPYHAQIVPTNKCNMSCSFCSCDGEDRKVEWSLKDAQEVVKILHKNGSKAFTITGGGEPLLFPHIDALVQDCYDRDIKMGLVTNGKLLGATRSDTLDKLTWCRISNGDERTMDKDYKTLLAKAINNAPGVDWAFSHVVSKKPNYDEIKRVVEFANEYNFTHVRLVADLFEPKDVPLASVKYSLLSEKVDDSKVIYQGRKSPSKGGDCFIGYLKPLVGADKKVYACCGVQYALTPPSKKMPEQLSLGKIEDLSDIVANSSKAFNGKQCDKCYYMSYNNVLGSLLGKLDHERFL